ncbi:MAG: hypothetical protein F6K41_00290 [Symploca sp. SIO3E6]|nr:hypothetical protein [Caldora sp. SIO3E6]
MTLGSNFLNILPKLSSCHISQRLLTLLGIITKTPAHILQKANGINLSQFPIPNSQFPIPNSQFPIPNSQFPIPNSQFINDYSQC